MYVRVIPGRLYVSCLLPVLGHFGPHTTHRQTHVWTVRTHMQDGMGCVGSDTDIHTPEYGPITTPMPTSTTSIKKMGYAGKGF